MNCTCVIERCDADSEAPEFYQEKKVTARKEHKCSECGATIKPGDKYIRVVGKWYDFMEYKTCMDCQLIADLMTCSRVLGVLWEDIHTAVVDGYDLPWSAIGELPESARNKLLDFVDNIWNEEEEEE